MSKIWVTSSCIQFWLRPGLFSLWTCHLQFRPQNSPYFLRKPRTRNSRTNGMEQMVAPSCLEQGVCMWGGGGGGWVRLGREAKNASKKYDRNCQRQNKRKKTKETKWQFHSLKAVEKLVRPNPFLLINNKAPKVLDAQVQYIPKNEGMHVFNL